MYASFIRYQAEPVRLVSVDVDVVAAAVQHLSPPPGCATPSQEVVRNAFINRGHKAQSHRETFCCNFLYGSVAGIKPCRLT